MKFTKILIQNKNYLIDVIIHILIIVFFLSYFKPSVLLLKTITCGGDTGSHTYTAVYLKNYLIPHGKIMGWMQGNYAGFPLFYHYFPLNFLFIVFISYFIPIEIAFKIGTILGTLLMPICVYFCFRLLNYKFPIPIIASIFSLSFIFNEGNSMWGGNIPSTLAGEFSYSLSFSILILFCGSIYKGIKEQKNIIPNAILIFLIGFSHGFTLIFSGIVSLFFLFTKEKFINNFIYLFKVFFLASLLLSLWLIPFIFNLPYVTNYLVKWYIKSIFEVLPLIIIPFIIISIISLFLNIFDRRTMYFLYIIISCIILYFASPYIGILNIRLVPFIQFFLVIFGSTCILLFLSQLKALKFIPFIALLGTILWIIPNVHYIENWIKWNYEGYESKKSWHILKEINTFLIKNNKGRVVYEHSDRNNNFGTVRTFENLPYFANRNTLEGLYLQSSISSPFVFYIQSEVSKLCSAPFPQYKYSQLNLNSAMPHLKMFNIGQYIAVSNEAKEQAKRIKDLKIIKKIGDYEIYEILNHDGKYVVPLDNKPVIYRGKNWKLAFFDWFSRNELLDTHLVYVKTMPEKALNRFGGIIKDDILNLQEIKIKKPQPEIKEKIGEESIEFHTNLISYPHLIKISYHPNWEIKTGADEIYLISPSFMLVYPTKNTVKIEFKRGLADFIGILFTLTGLVIIISTPWIKKYARR